MAALFRLCARRLPGLREASVDFPGLLYLRCHLSGGDTRGRLVGWAGDSLSGVQPPAKPGETIVAYANGFGTTTAPIASGAVRQSGILTGSLVVGIGGLPASVQFAD